VPHKTILEDVNAKLGKQNVFEPTYGNESLYQDSNDYDVIIVNFDV
jgi:hypothetical protein